MNIKSPKFTISCITTLLLVSFWLASCTNSNNPPAPISSVNWNNNINNNSNSIFTTPSETSAVALQQTAVIQQEKHKMMQSMQLQSIKQSMQVQNNRIIYDRHYVSIPKGSYIGSCTYKVKRGDTLFYIAWITGNNFYDLAQRNNIQSPYNLKIGQMLHVSKVKGEQLILSKVPVTNLTKPSISNTSNLTNSSISTWCWPTEGRIIENFSPFKEGNKGIDIAGNRGQIIVATADGRVVYAGNALRGYGNLIIIKHNDDYLSAYAHNDTMLVREQQKVKAGQKIAMMGGIGTSSTRLHFEIRYKGKSVNPLQYLPQRQFCRK